MCSWSILCSPAIPPGRSSASRNASLFELSADAPVVIAAVVLFGDLRRRCASPLRGARGLQARLRRDDYRNVVMFSSLSSARRNVPGMRSGFVAGDATICSMLLYRTYHAAPRPIGAGIDLAAWNDEAHVAENRRSIAKSSDW